jgi:hypothetical protein
VRTCALELGKSRSEACSAVISNTQWEFKLSRQQGQQNYMRGRVNHVTAESSQEAPDVVFGTFLINSKLASILFDSGASHSFITDQFMIKHNLTMCPMKQILLVSSPGKELKASHLCPRVNMNIMGVEFLANLIMLQKVRAPNQPAR